MLGARNRQQPMADDDSAYSDEHLGLVERDEPHVEALCNMNLETVRSFKDLMEKLNEQPPSPPIKGNVFRYWGLGLSKGNVSSPMANAALLVLVIIQIVAPVAILFWVTHQISDWSEVSWGLADWTYVYGSDTCGISHLMKRILGLMFLFCFVVNSLITIIDEGKQWTKVHKLTQIEELKDWERCTFWLHVGPIVNSVVVILCCVDMLLLMAQAEHPKDVVFDSLGLLFLFTLDDVGNGGLNFLTEADWPSAKLGELYGQKCHERRSACPGCDCLCQEAHLAHKLATWVLLMFVPLLPIVFCFVQGLSSETCRM